jgi:hypothetical protein
VFQVRSKLRSRLELGNGIQFLERRSEGIRQTPHRTWLEVFVLRRITYSKLLYEEAVPLMEVPPVPQVYPE